MPDRDGCIYDRVEAEAYADYLADGRLPRHEVARDEGAPEKGERDEN